MDEMKTDIVKLVKCFDMFLDDMFDRGAFDPSEKNDGELQAFVNEMKEKYLNA